MENKSSGYKLKSIRWAYITSEYFSPFPPWKVTGKKTGHFLKYWTYEKLYPDFIIHKSRTCKKNSLTRTSVKTCSFALLHTKLNSAFPQSDILVNASVILKCYGLFRRNHWLIEHVRMPRGIQKLSTISKKNPIQNPSETHVIATSNDIVISSFVFLNLSITCKSILLRSTIIWRFILTPLHYWVNVKLSLSILP